LIVPFVPLAQARGVATNHWLSVWVGFARNLSPDSKQYISNKANFTGRTIMKKIRKGTKKTAIRDMKPMKQVKGGWGIFVG